MTGARQRSKADRVGAARRRAGLAKALLMANMTPADAARSAGMVSANGLYNFLNGRAASLSQSTLEALAEVIPNATVSSLSGLDLGEHIGPPTRPVRVCASARAGLMRTQAEWPAVLQREVYLPIQRDWLIAGAYGLEVEEPGAELMYRPGTILVCIPLSFYQGPLYGGMRVVLQRIRDGQVEVTLRELKLEANEAWLWQRSTHPSCQMPIPMPYAPNSPLTPWVSGEDRFIVAAVVVASYETYGPPA